MNPPVLTPIQATHMRAWIADLRSGLYRQATQRLRTPYDGEGFAHCCLGVAAERAIKDGCRVAWQGIATNWLYELDRTGYSTSALLTPAVVDWFGFDTVYAKILVACRQLGPRTQSLNVCADHYKEGHDYTTCGRVVKVEATALNDIFHWNFNQIADAFEHYYFGAPEATNAPA